MAPIQPKFDVDEFGNLIVGEGQEHLSTHAIENILRPALFNEYERVMWEIAETIGDTDWGSLFGSVLGTYQGVPYTFAFSPATIAESFTLVKQTLKDIYETKIGPEGGEILGSLSIDGSLTVSAGISTGSITAEKTIDTGSIRSIWKAGVDYQTNAIVVAPDGNLYICTVGHTSSSNFVTDIGKWDLLSSAGTARFIISVPENYEYTFSEGDAIYHDVTGFKPAIATSSETLATAVVTRVLSSTRYEIATGGPVTFSTALFDTSGGIYYLSSTNAGKLVSTKPATFAQQVYRAVNATTAFITIEEHAHGAFIESDTFIATGGSQSFTLSRAVPSSELAFVTLNNLLLNPEDYTIDGTTLTITGTTLEPGDVIVCRYFYGDNYTAVNLTVEEYIAPAQNIFTASAGQQEFTLSQTPASDDGILVFVDAAFRGKDSWSRNGNIITLATPCTGGESVIFVYPYISIPNVPADGSVTVQKLASDVTDKFRLIKLTDVPDSYSGQAGKAIVVNSTEDGVEFGDVSVSQIGDSLIVTINTSRLILKDGNDVLLCVTNSERIWKY